MKPCTLVLASIALLTPSLFAIGASTQSGGTDKPAAKPDDKPADKPKRHKFSEIGADSTPLDQIAMGLSFMLPGSYAAAVKGESKSMELIDRKEMLARVETCLKSTPGENDSASTKRLHERYAAHAEATRKIFAAIDQLDGAAVKYLFPKMKPCELPLGIDHLTQDEKGPLFGLLVCAFLEKPTDASTSKPVDRLRRLARDVALPAVQKMAASARDLGLEQIGLVLLQPCTDPKAEGKDATKAELALCLFDVASLEQLSKKEIDAKAVFAKATIFHMSRDERMLAKTEALRE